MVDPRRELAVTRQDSCPVSTYGQRSGLRGEGGVGQLRDMLYFPASIASLRVIASKTSDQFRGASWRNSRAVGCHRV